MQTQIDNKAPKKRRPIDGSAIFGGIRNGDPTRDYAWVAPAGGFMGPEYFYQLGYEVETHREGGPVVAGMRGAKAGANIELHGCVLMSIDKELKAELVAKGDGLAIGQEGFDKIMSDIRKTVGGGNLARGLGLSPEVASASMDISRLTPDR